jgi:hypothetical protein
MPPRRASMLISDPSAVDRMSSCRLGDALKEAGGHSDCRPQAVGRCRAPRLAEATGASSKFHILLAVWRGIRALSGNDIVENRRLARPERFERPPPRFVVRKCLFATVSKHTQQHADSST